MMNMGTTQQFHQETHLLLTTRAIVLAQIIAHTPLHHINNIDLEFKTPYVHNSKTSIPKPTSVHTNTQNHILVTKKYANIVKQDNIQTTQESEIETPNCSSNSSSFSPHLQPSIKLNNILHHISPPADETLAKNNANEKHVNQPK
ncbi:hypothetical protein CHS0354_000185, partial [Potamilus streckersoni]